MQWNAESGLYCTSTRCYDPTLGRWLSPDSVGFSGGDFNLYRYNLNNPVLYTDPRGTTTPIGASLSAVCALIDVAQFFYAAYQYDKYVKQAQQLDAEAKAIEAMLEPVNASSSENARAFCDAGNDVVQEKEAKALELQRQFALAQAANYNNSVKLGVFCGVLAMF